MKTGKTNTAHFKIEKREIGSGRPVFIIAEISANHRQNFERAKKLVETACRCGADAIKLQTFTPDTITINSLKDLFVVKSDNPWKGRNLYDLYREAYMPWQWQPELKKIAKKYGIPLFSTPYDETAVDFLEKMGAPAYKIASFEINDTGLLKKIAFTKKPVIVSRGMASLKELELAVSTLRKNGTKEIAILHCVSNYPAKVEEMNLATMQDIKKRFKTPVGLSDHSLGISAAIVSVVLGASIIEKHFTLRREDGGPDADFSLEPDELKELVKSVREAEKSIGKAHYGPTKGESENIVFRRSLFVVRDIKKGEVFNAENVRSIRPGYGLPPFFMPKILGRRAKKNIEKGTPLTKKLIQ